MSNNRRRSNWSDDYNDINLGFGVRQQKQYERPRVQILTPCQPLPPQQKKICPGCDNSLTWLEEPSRRFICYSCGVSYHEEFTSLPTSNDASIKPLQSTDPYTQITPAFVSKKRDRGLQGEFPDNGPIESITGNARVKKVKLKPGVSPAAYNMKDDWKYEL